MMINLLLLLLLYRSTRPPAIQNTLQQIKALSIYYLKVIIKWCGHASSVRPNDCYGLWTWKVQDACEQWHSLPSLLSSICHWILRWPNPYKWTSFTFLQWPYPYKWAFFVSKRIYSTGVLLYTSWYLFEDVVSNLSIQPAWMFVTRQAFWTHAINHYP